MAGRVRSFSDDELKVLRALARKLKKDNDWSGRALGEAIGIAQQNASRFVADNSTSGIDRTTGNQIAVKSGFRDVEHALLEAGALAEMEALPAGNPWRDRDVAMRVAVRMGYSEEVVHAVAHRYRSHDYSGKPMRWWMDMIVLEGLQRGADPPPTPVSPPASSRPATPTTAEHKPKRKRSGTEG